VGGDKKMGGDKKIVKSWEVILLYQKYTKEKEKRSHSPLAAGEAGGGEGAGKSRQRDGSASAGAAGGAGVTAAGVKEELEGRSAYMKQVLSDRERYGEMILDLEQQLTTLRPSSAAHVAMLVEELEKRLALLSDERAVLKAFPNWPESKVEALRDIAARMREVQACRKALDVAAAASLSSESEELKRCMQMFNKTQALVEWFERNQEDLGKRWLVFGLVFDFAAVADLKAACVSLSKHAMLVALSPVTKYQVCASVSCALCVVCEAGYLTDAASNPNSCCALPKLMLRPT
jgi:hypothetical protein